MVVLVLNVKFEKLQHNTNTIYHSDLFEIISFIHIAFYFFQKTIHFIN